MRLVAKVVPAWLLQSAATSSSAITHTVRAKSIMRGKKGKKKRPFSRKETNPVAGLLFAIHCLPRGETLFAADGVRVRIDAGLLFCTYIGLIRSN